MIATQNPQDQLGTYALPESQLDRFLMRISLGYPDRGCRAPAAGGHRPARHGGRHAAAALAATSWRSCNGRCWPSTPPSRCSNYVQDLIAATRSGRWFVQGLSPRAGIALMRAAKAQALISGRDYVAPDDVQAIIAQTIAHRLVPVGSAGRGAVEQVRAMVEAVPLP